MNLKTVVASVGAAFVLSGALWPANARAQATDTTGAAVQGSRDSDRTNPFADVETHFLSNGLKVWFKRLEGVPNVSASVVVPYGSDLDPSGEEQLAHFTEHMLFGDHDGKTEEEIKDAVEGLGGRRNGTTSSDRTFYYVTIAKEHGLFAIEWLSRIVSPHAMEPEVVDRGRQPVAVEINARPMEFFERVFLALNPEWLRPEGFWQREFGMETRPLIYDSWTTLHRITPEDLRGFYDRYYAPGAMTLTIVGDLDSAEVLELAERTFGTLPEREVAPLAYDVEDPRRGRATYAWGLGSDIGYQKRYKFFNHTAEDELHILFIRDLLGRRLNQRLRYGERKAVYGLSVFLSKRGPAAYLQLAGDINEDEYDYALEVLDEELALLRTGGLDPAEFETDRRAIIERLRTVNLTAQALNFWSRSNFYNPNVFTDFPDVVGFFEEVTQAELASFATRNLVADRELLSVTYMQPVSQGVLVLVVLLIVILTHRGVSWGLTRPIEMRKIRYVARFRTPLLIRIVRVIVFGGLGLVLARLVVALLIWAGGDWVATVASYVVQMASYAFMLSGSIALVILYLARFPRKLLVFPDHVRVKSWAYASRSLAPEDVQEISLRGFRDVWLSSDIFRCTALTFGLLRPGLYVRPKKGRALFFGARDTEELTEVLAEWRGESVGEHRVVAPEAEAPAEPPPPEDVPALAPESPTPEAAVPQSPVSTTETSDTSAAPQRADDDAEDVDIDDVGLTEEEKRDLLGE